MRIRSTLAQMHWLDVEKATSIRFMWGKVFDEIVFGETSSRIFDEGVATTAFNTKTRYDDSNDAPETCMMKLQYERCYDNS